MPAEDPLRTEEPIRTDASTVQRTADQLSDEAADVAHGSSRRDAEVEQLEQAKTVIRGSSRVENAKPRTDTLRHTPAAVAQVLAGGRLNHFLLEELIGGGGMGAVFRAQDEQLDRTVAIKVIPFVGDDPDLQRRFRNEAQSAAKLDHPRIARVFDVGSHDEWHYIVFEYIEGTNIRDLVSKHGVMSIDEAVFYTSQLADALQHAADRGIVHRDIKPSNVLIGGGGKIKLVDMGLARSDNLELSEDMTASGVTLGTFDYISPEQAHDPRDADLRSDIYSLGCTLYFMLTGSPPYPGGTMLQKLLSHGNAPPPDPRELRPEVSDNLVAVIQKMLAKNPDDRYQTATDLIADLREVAFRDGLRRSQALSPVTITQPNPLIGWLERHAPLGIAGALLIAVAGWLHLDAAAMREDIAIPTTARRPQMTQARPTAVEVTPETPSSDSDSGAAGSQLDPPSGSDLDLTPDSSTYASPDEAPQFADVQIPSELFDEPNSNAMRSPGRDFQFRFNDLLDDTDAPFTMSTPFFEGDEDVSIEPLEQLSTHVVRLVGPSDAAAASPEQRDADGAAIATTFAEALQLAEENQASRIEIAVPVVHSDPVKVRVDDLLITSTVGGSTIVFQPADSVAMERSKMLSIGDHQIEFDDLHFVWNVPSGDIDGGTLFELNDNKLVRFTDCSITVSNPTLQDEVYAFDVITNPDALPVEPEEDLAESGDDTDELPLVWVELNNVVIRGQITMLHMDYAAKLWLFWDNGLLAVTQQMIDTAGALRPEAADQGPIFLQLTRVTAHAPRGIFRMRTGVSGAYPVPIDRFARKSVFCVDPDTPHFEISGLSSVGDAPELLQLRGASNAYVVQPNLTDPMLRLATMNGQTETTRMNDLLSAAPPNWADETAPRWAVNWASMGIPVSPASQRTPADYRQDDVSPPGFDQKSLPILPAAGDPSGGLSPDEERSGVRAALRHTENRGDL